MTPGINSLVQAAKARARSYRTSKNLISMIYLISGKLKLALPTPNSEKPVFSLIIITMGSLKLAVKK